MRAAVVARGLVEARMLGEIEFLGHGFSSQIAVAHRGAFLRAGQQGIGTASNNC
jgi:hypothetical protein